MMSQKSDDKLLILWTSGDPEVAKKMVLLYGSVILPRGYWDRAHLMVWGPSARLLAQNDELQAMLKTVLESGVEASVCVACSDDYGVTEKLRSLGVEPEHTGELLTEALKSGWKTIML
jgi:hypothetical protein